MVLNLTETTGKTHMLVVCLPLQATGFISKICISPFHYGLFNHFEIPAAESAAHLGIILDTKSFDVSHTPTCNKTGKLYSKDHCNH